MGCWTGTLSRSAGGCRCREGRLYRTTKAFLRAFHLNSLEDLPEMPGMEADGQLRLAEDGSVLDNANA